MLASAIATPHTQTRALSGCRIANCRPLVSRRSQSMRLQAIGGGEPGQEKKFLTREQEPEEYWVSKGERQGENPLKDPLAIIGIISILFPFVFLLVAILFGWVDVDGGRL